MGKPMRILIMAMAVASGDAFIVSPKAQLAARRTLPHARAMPIVAGHSKFEDEGKLYTSVCPHACVMSHLAYGPREPVDPLPPLPPPPPTMLHPLLAPLARARPLPVTLTSSLMTLLFTPSPRRAPSTLPTASGSVFPPLPPQAEQTVNWLVAFDKNWLTPSLPLLILYGGIEIGDDGLGFWALVFALVILHGWILKLKQNR